jgi:hypothetical protein
MARFLRLLLAELAVATILIAVVLHWGSDLPGPAIGGLIFLMSVAITAIGTFLTRRRRELPPARVYLVFLGALAFFGLIAWFLSLLGPILMGILILALAIPVAQLTIRDARSRRWRNAGLCPGCGYDIRATPERCPECGLDFPCELPRLRRVRAAMAEARAGQSAAPPQPTSDPKPP